VAIVTVVVVVARRRRPRAVLSSNVYLFSGQPAATASLATIGESSLANPCYSPPDTLVLGSSPGANDPMYAELHISDAGMGDANSGYIAVSSDADMMDGVTDIAGGVSNPLYGHPGTSGVGGSDIDYGEVDA